MNWKSGHKMRNLFVSCESRAIKSFYVLFMHNNSAIVGHLVHIRLTEYDAYAFEMHILIEVALAKKKKMKKKKRNEHARTRTQHCHSGTLGNCIAIRFHLTVLI